MDVITVGIRDTERSSLIYYMTHILHYSDEEALIRFSRLTKYKDIYDEFSRVSFGYFRSSDSPAIEVAGQTAFGIRACRNCTFLEAYLELVSLRDKENQL